MCVGVFDGGVIGGVGCGVWVVSFIGVDGVLLLVLGWVDCLVKVIGYVGCRCWVWGWVKWFVLVLVVG